MSECGGVRREGVLLQRTLSIMPAKPAMSNSVVGAPSDMEPVLP